MNPLSEIPLGARMAAAAMFGLVVGAIVNLATYTLAWEAQPLSPWQPHPGDGRRKLRDRFPVLGWFGRDDEEPHFGRFFWLRPMLIEVFCGLAVPLLYWWEVDQLALLPASLAARGMQPEWVSVVQGQYALHVILLLLMLAASLIDLDEKNIPDGITVPGTLVLLAAAALFPQGLLPIVTLGAADGALPTARSAADLGWLSLSTPHEWPAALEPSARSLALALGLYLAWCLALLPRVWRARRGLGWAWRIFTAHIAREPFSRIVALLALGGSVAITAAYQRGGDGWRGLLTALVGMAVSGGLVWAVRGLGGAVLGREAMGFGDVTLMGMIGAYVGWQTGLVVFFFAPFFALLIAVGQWMLRRDPEIPYGPYLCLATATIVVGWPRFWAAVERYFELPWLVPSVVAFCLVGLTVLLTIFQVGRRLLGIERDE